MNSSILFRNWWVILIQGILMIVLSIFIFENPGAVLLTLAFWIGIMVIVNGLYGVIGYFATAKEDRDLINLLRSVVMCLIGFMMVSKMIVTMIVLTIMFGLLATSIGLQLIIGSWKGRKSWSLWWVIALNGIAAIVIGIDSIMDIESGAQSISTLIGIAFLLSGIGLICLAFLKKKIVSVIRNKITEMKP